MVEAGDGQSGGVVPPKDAVRVDRSPSVGGVNMALERVTPGSAMTVGAMASERVYGGAGESERLSRFGHLYAVSDGGADVAQAVVGGVMRDYYGSREGGSNTQNALYDAVMAVAAEIEGDASVVVAVCEGLSNGGVQVTYTGVGPSRLYLGDTRKKERDALLRLKPTRGVDGQPLRGRPAMTLGHVKRRRRFGVGAIKLAAESVPYSYLVLGSPGFNVLDQREIVGEVSSRWPQGLRSRTNDIAHSLAGNAGNKARTGKGKLGVGGDIACVVVPLSRNPRNPEGR